MSSRTQNSTANPPLRRVPRRLPSGVNLDRGPPARGFSAYNGSSGFSNQSDFSNRGGGHGGFPGGFGSGFGIGGGSTSGHGHPMPFTPPAPLTTRSLATHLNQMQKAETGSTSSRVGGGGEGHMASHREKVPFDMAYAQAAFNQSRSRSASNANSDVQSTAARRPSGGGMMSMNPGPATNASSGGTGRKSYGQVINQGQSMSIEALLSKPPSGNLMDALKELRSLILSEGIPADADGHVCSSPSAPPAPKVREPLLMNIIVLPTNLRLVHSPRRPPHALQGIPRPRSPWRLASILQNPQ